MTATSATFTISPETGEDVTVIATFPDGTEQSFVVPADASGPWRQATYDMVVAFMLSQVVSS